MFEISAFLGTAVGFGGAFLLMPNFYALQNEDNPLPEVSVHIHPSIFLYFVALPTFFFAVLSIGYVWYKLHTPALLLLKDNLHATTKAPRPRPEPSRAVSFLDDLKHNTLRSKKALVFFIVFASFCFSAMTQMSFSMKELSNKMIGAMMRVFGYSQKECCKAILGGYRPVSYIGFAIGTLYQYALLRVMFFTLREQ